MYSPARPDDVIAFCNDRIEKLQKRIDANAVWLEASKAAHEKTIWFRWFKMKWEYPMWDSGCMRASWDRGWVEELIALKAKANYCAMRGYEPVELPKRWADSFYNWISKNV